VSRENSKCCLPGQLALVVAMCFRVGVLEVSNSGDLPVEYNCYPGPASVMLLEVVWLNREVMQCDGIVVSTPQSASWDYQYIGELCRLP